MKAFDTFVSASLQKSELTTWLLNTKRDFNNRAESWVWYTYQRS